MQPYPGSCYLAAALVRVSHCAPCVPVPVKAPPRLKLHLRYAYCPRLGFVVVVGWIGVCEDSTAHTGALQRGSWVSQLSLLRLACVHAVAVLSVCTVLSSCRGCAIDTLAQCVVPMNLLTCGVVCGV